MRPPTLRALRASLESASVVRVVALLAALAVPLALLFIDADALAQHSGGSIGGGSFGGGGGRSYGGGGSSYHYGGGGGGAGLVRLLIELFRFNPILGTVVLLAILAFVILRARAESQGGTSMGSSLPNPESRLWRQVDITEVRIALDGRARAFLQRELMSQAQRANTRTKAGLLRVLHTVALALQKSESAWVYAGAKNFRPMSSVLAEATFRRLASDARAKFTHELVRNASGATQTSESHGVVRSAEREGEGVVLVTLIVAANREILDFRADSRASIGSVLVDLLRLAEHDLVALECVWMPAEERDLLSTATLTQLHPDLVLLPGAVGGLVVCPFCQGPHTAELPRCPHCGAPTASSTSAGPLR